MTETLSAPRAIATMFADAVGALERTEKRQLVALAGPPGAGKSTVSEALMAELRSRGSPAGLLAMDGYHLDNAILIARGLLARKGAPETFDVAGFRAMLARLMSEDEVVVPSFDRTLDKSIAGSAVVGREDRIVIVEGNYLLLDEPEWTPCDAFWSLRLYLDVPLDVLEERLVQRWLDYGLPPDAARERALSNDIPNARRVVAGSRPADVVGR